MSDALLTVQDVHAGYLPGVDILRGLSVNARPNEITLVIGPNGAGKSTLLRTVFAFLTPNQGTIKFRDKTTNGLRPSDLKSSGISYVTQDINSFPNLTVEENLRMGAWVFRRDKERLQRQLDRAYAVFPALAAKRGARAGELSGGQGRMLSVAREMMTEPQLLLVDEILMTTKKASDIAILLVEQNVTQALPLADYLYLLNLGRVKAEGPGRDFDNTRVRA